MLIKCSPSFFCLFNYTGNEPVGLGRRWREERLMKVTPESQREPNDTNVTSAMPIILSSIYLSMHPSILRGNGSYSRASFRPPIMGKRITSNARNARSARWDKFILQETESCILCGVGNMSVAAAFCFINIVRHGCVISPALLTDVKTLRGITIKADQDEAAAVAAQSVKYKKKKTNTNSSPSS